MNYIKHIGIYVSDLEKMTYFYKNCFSMHVICDNRVDSGILYDSLFKEDGISVTITKLVTEYGMSTHIGEMIELIQLKSELKQTVFDRKVFDMGLSHISVTSESIFNTVELVLLYGGRLLTEVLSIGDRFCCFCLDPEGNVIEIIQ